MTAELHNYLRQFASMARARRMPGNRIGEAIAEIETHTADTGEDPQETFGKPQAYATQLASEGPQLPPPSYGRCLASFFGFLIGAFLLLGAAHRTTNGGVLQLGWTLLLPLGASALAAALLAFGYRRDPRGAVWVFPLLLLVASLMQPQGSWGSGLTVAPSVALPIGAALAVVSMVAWWWALPRPGPIIDSAGTDRTPLGRPTTGTVVGNIVVAGILVGFAVAHSWLDILPG